MKSPKSARSARRRLRFLPTPRDRLILEAVSTHGRLTGSQIRRLFFIREDGHLASVQAVNARLRRLVALGHLEPLVVNAGHGAGPYAYGLGSLGRMMLARPPTWRRAGGAGTVWHYLEIAEFRISLQEALQRRGGELVEWLGEPVVRALLAGRRGWPVPDALIQWRLPRREGAFFLEWDRGTESLGMLTAKVSRYVDYWRVRAHRELVPGLGLRPRLLLVLDSNERAGRVTRWLVERRRDPRSSTILVGVAEAVLAAPLGHSWWRSDNKAKGTFHQ